MKNKKIFLLYSPIILILFIISCYNNNAMPKELTVNKVEYYEDYQGYYLRVYTDLESGYVFGTQDSGHHIKWGDICTIENNTIIGDDYSKYFTFAVQIQNRLNSVTDKGKSIYFNDKIFPISDSYDSVAYTYCCISTTSKEITF